MKIIPVISFVLLFTCSAVFSKVFATKPPSKQLTLYFHNRMGNADLALGTPTKTILGEPLTIERFRYYVSNFSVKDQSGNSHVLPVQYFLIDEEDSTSKKITLTIPDIIVSSIHFLLGVDSIRNVSGVQTDALDPLKGMFWTWNTGYIMAKLEGTSDSAHSAGHRFTHHIGGFKTGTNTARNIELTVPKNNMPQQIHITADINHWFKSKTEIRIAETPICHAPGALAVKIADNYSTMFSINPAQ